MVTAEKPLDFVARKGGFLIGGRTAKSPAQCQDMLASCLTAEDRTSWQQLRLVCHRLYCLRGDPADLTRDQLARLADLLQPEPAPAGTDISWTVAPRSGLITPWSSKACDILSQCGLPLEVEALFVWRLMLPPHLNPEHEDLKATVAGLRALSCDPMHQVLLKDQNERNRWLDFWLGNEEPALSAMERIPLDKLISCENPALQPLEEDERIWLAKALRKAGRQDISLPEAMMFSQLNSEHCRHWIFRSGWHTEDGEVPYSLFDLIQKTSKAKSGWKPGLISCYSDNAAVFEGFGTSLLAPDSRGNWRYLDSPVHLVAKAETHNHPTGISPWPGAATGVGGEIRDEAAAGRGARSKMGVCGYMVSHPDWRAGTNSPLLSPEGAAFAGPRQILAQAPLGAAAYANEFGRPTLAGFLRTLEVPGSAVENPAGQVEFFGYDKPLMLAGGLGCLLAGQEHKAEVPEGALLFVLGGPAMRIGIGGGSASSFGGASQDSGIDFASVQRDNPEMQRRCQEVLDSCWRLGDNNPVLFIHDLGAGGLSNAVPELLKDCGRGGRLKLFHSSDSRGQLLAEDGMRPEEIWCNESQERFLLAIERDQKEAFIALCDRESCPFALLGETTKTMHLDVGAQPDLHLGDDDRIIDLPLSSLFDYERPQSRPLVAGTEVRSTDDAATAARMRAVWQPDAKSALDGKLAIRLAGELLAWPSVASKAFLIQIGDRSVGGLTVRDQMAGPRQIPVADCALTLAGHRMASHQGEAVAMGEKAALAMLDPEASVRMAVAEALTNLAAAGISDPSEVRLSANWMASLHDAEASGTLYRAVEALSEFCCALDIAIPVGKDSLFMRSKAWLRQGEWLPERHEDPTEVSSPVTLAITAFAPVEDLRKHVTPDLEPPITDSEQRRLSGTRPSGEPKTLLVHIDLGSGRRRLGGSTWQQIEAQYLHRPMANNRMLAQAEAEPALHGPTPDIAPQALRHFMAAIAALTDSRTLLAYHDISDGGLFACAFEMALAGGCGVRLYPGVVGWAEGLFHEEAGALIQIRAKDLEQVLQSLAASGLDAGVVGHPIEDARFELGPDPSDESDSCDTLSFAMHSGEDGHDYPWPATKARDLAKNALFAHLTEAWTLNSDSVRCARGDRLVAEEAEGYATEKHRLAPSCHRSQWPQGPVLISGSGKGPVAILREQGVNGQTEMAGAFLQAGMEARDVHMGDLLAGRVRLEEFSGLAFCGGFSYGDTLGAGRGWGRKIIHTPELKEQFSEFFRHENRFVIGICNGCQALSAMREIIPGAELWPDFTANLSGRYEARLTQVLIDERAAEASPLLAGMGGQILLVPVSHGEGRARFETENAITGLQQSPLAGIACRYGAAENLAELADRKRERAADLTPQEYREFSPLTEACYPLNPNGSTDGIAGVFAAEGRVLAMMPHPERVYRTLQLSWAPPEWRYDERGNWREDSPWMQLFRNAARL